MGTFLIDAPAALVAQFARLAERAGVQFRVRAVLDGSSSAQRLEEPHSPSMAPLLLSYETTAAVLDVSVATVKRLVRSKALPVVKVASSPRIRSTDLEDYVASLEPTNTTEAA